MAGGVDRNFEARELGRWQRRLLPFVIAAISLMAVFFFVSSLVQLDRLGKAIAFQPSDSIERGLVAYERKQVASGSNPENLDYLRWKTLVLLEREALNHRYTQVNATLMLRAWTRHLGFLTGMILALVGAIFILAKLNEAQTTLSAESSGVKGTLATSSPGIVLAVLGTVLMVVTLTANFEFSTTDAPVYLGPDRQAAAAAPDTLPPAPQLLDEGRRQSEEKDLFGTPDKETGDAQ